MHRSFRRLLPAPLLALVALLFAGPAAFAQSSAGGAKDSTPAPLAAAPRFEFRADASEQEGVRQDEPGDQSGGQGGQQGGTQSGGQNANARPPLTSEEKMKRAFKGAFLSPRPYVFSALTATLTQAGEDGLPDKDFEDELGDWGSRFARNMATSTTRTIFGSGIYPVLFKQDPRYDPATKKGFGPRAAHALSRVFVQLDDEGNVEPAYSRIAGRMTAAAMANVWERSTPGHDRIGADATLRRFARYFVTDAAFNVIREFWPDLMGIFKK